MQTEEKLIVGTLVGLAIAAAPAYLPKSAPIWVWDTFHVAFVVVLMVGAATAAVAWERYGPKGCRLHEFEASRVVDEISVSDESGDTR